MTPGGGSAIKQPLFNLGPSPALRLVLCAALSLVLMTLDHRHQHLQELRSALATLVYPVQYAADLPVRIGRWTSEQFATHRTLISRNARLQAENLRLQGRMLRFEALQAENARLRTLLDTSSRVREEVVIAELLSVDLDPFRQQVVLDKGRVHDVYPGQPLINAQGVVGQVLEVHPMHSIALLISDPSHALPVRIQRTGLRTLAMGTGNPKRLELRFIPPSEDVRVGDMVRTSGLGERFPADYPVAEVVHVERPEGAEFAVVQARPLARLDRTREVLLLWSRRQEQAPEPSLEEAPPARTPGQDASPPAGVTPDKTEPRGDGDA
ncbi:rod shape-determining protein MreC [Ectothiorhodospira mobilis]|uniref:rod shape-determining protein MreC n=1 Tax=Ectothiorhodospira mobilis TaxID=195064 RepID=UPI0019055557|nr:rod shape-determining protein MreC [Ectothiorhodospira mobilis]